MRNEELIALALAGIAVWMILKSKTVAAAPVISARISAPPLFHPADAYAGSWTANGPFVPSAYDKQIWD